MKKSLKVFSTKKEIRFYAMSHTNSLLPKLLTLEEFLDRAILLPNPQIPSDLRKLYLFEVVKKIDPSVLGISTELEVFLEQSDLIYSFFRELFLEEVELEEVKLADVYAKFEEHITLLEELRDHYKQMLQERGLSDLIFEERIEVNREYFKEFEEIEIYLRGYLTRFDRWILKELNHPNLKIFYTSTPFNAPLIKKMFGVEEYGSFLFFNQEHKKLAPYKELTITPEVKAFGERIEQVEFVFSKIAEFVESGISPDDIVVVTPDEGFSELLELFDEKDNLNLSMGKPFKHSNLFITLQKLYEEALIEDVKDEEFFKILKEKNTLELFSYILKLASPTEKSIIDEVLFKFKEFTKGLTPFQTLHLLLKEFEKLSFDDVRGGKVTVIGVLEGRGIEAEGVIVVDFNEEFVPKITNEDLFLNTSLRKRVNLPTLGEKRALQKFYYYTLFKNAKRVAISYHKSEEKDVSRFLYELWDKVELDPKEYKIFNFNRFRGFEEVKGELSLPKVFTPTSLKTLLRCPYEFSLLYEKKIYQDSSQPSIHTLIHRAIEEAIKSEPSSWQEYYNEIEKYLFNHSTREQMIDISGRWLKRLKKFTQQDFENLSSNLSLEITQSKKLGDFILQAKADRVIEGRIIDDFKTASSSDYLKDYQKDETNYQAEFYSYIWDSDEVYFYLISHKVQRQRVEIDPKSAKEKLEKVLANLPTTLSYSQDQTYCHKYCVYRFGCKGVS